jgi:hypothetical protein
VVLSSTVYEVVEGGSVDVEVEIVGNISLERSFDVFITIDPPIRGRFLELEPESFSTTQC